MKSSEIESNLSVIRDIMETDVDSQAPIQVLDNLGNLTAIVGLSAEMVAQSNHLHTIKKLQILKSTEGKGLSPSVIAQYVRLESNDEEMVATYAERICAGLTHVIDGRRSQLSYLKEEMRNSLNG